MNNTIRNRDSLIKTLDEYIEFLGDEINSNAAFLDIHGIRASDSAIKKGVELRAKIRILRKKL